MKNSIHKTVHVVLWHSIDLQITVILFCKLTCLDFEIMKTIQIHLNSENMQKQIKILLLLLIIITIIIVILVTH